MKTNFSSEIPKKTFVFRGVKAQKITDST